jgi:uncharacterized protein (TIGR03437 family)
MSMSLSVETIHMGFPRKRVLLLLCSISAISAQNVVLTLGSGSGNPGATVTLPITLTNLGGPPPSSLQWSFSYPTAITGVTVTVGSAATSAQKVLACGGSACAIYGTNQTGINSGVVAMATFQLAPSVSGSIPISLTNVIAASAAAGSIPATSGPGTIAVTALPSLTTVSCAATSITAPGNTSCTVTLSAPAPVGGIQVSLSSSNLGLSVPLSVVIPVGQTNASFTATAGTITTTSVANVSATFNGQTRTTQIQLSPSVHLSAISCSPSSVPSLGTATCTVSLTSASLSPSNITITTSDSSVIAPTFVVVAAGRVSASFQINAGIVASPQRVILTANIFDSTVVTSVSVIPTLGLFSPVTYQPGQSCSPGAIATVIGSGLTNQSPQVATGPLPLRLAGAQLIINDQPVPLLYASSTLIHFQCPALAPGTALRLVVKSDFAQPPPTISTIMQEATPGVYVLDNSQQGAVLIAGTDIVATASITNSQSRPAKKGEYISIYADGLGAVTEMLPPGQPAPFDHLIRARTPVTVFIGNSELALPPSFVGLTPGVVSLFVVNVQLTSDVQTGTSVPLYLGVTRSDGTVIKSNTVRIAVASSTP